MPSINKRVMAIATASRTKGPEGEPKRTKQCKDLLWVSPETSVERRASSWVCLNPH